MDFFTDFFSGSFDWIIDYGLPFVIVLSVLVFVHEWGHYIVARMCGVKVITFSIGFGKEIFGFNDKNGTRWKFSAIPLGGYVQMFGDTDPASAGTTEKAANKSNKKKTKEEKQFKPMTAEERKVAFFSQPLWQRAAIVFAGPAINFIFAILLLFGLYISLGKPVTPPVATAIVVDGPAHEAGILPHDEIVSINGRSIKSFEQVQRSVLVGLDEGMDIIVRRNGEEVLFENISPTRITEEDRFGFQQSRGQLGIIGPGFQIDASTIKAVDGRNVTKETSRAAILSKLNSQAVLTIPGPEEDMKVLVVPKHEDNQAFIDFDTSSEELQVLSLAAAGTGSQVLKLPATTALYEASLETKNIVVSTLEALWQIISGTRSAKELGGIIRIGAIAGDAAQAGIIALITFTALLSINLGLINLFPIPMLDGGHLLFYAVEAIKGGPIPEQAQEYAFRFGLAVLVALMLFANLNDIVQLVL